jgi:hypothetical protein
MLVAAWPQAHFALPCAVTCDTGLEQASHAIDRRRNLKMTATKSEKVPRALKAKFDEIVAITDAFAVAHLDDEYRQLIRYAVAALCRKRPSPLEKGRANTWACGVTHAIGMVNFLFDPSQTPHMKVADLYRCVFHAIRPPVPATSGR